MCGGVVVVVVVVVVVCCCCCWFFFFVSFADTNFVFLFFFRCVFFFSFFSQCNEWYYWTTDGPQGPFTHAQMSVWHEHGYLDSALQCKRGGEGKEVLTAEGFRPLSEFLGVDF